MNDKNNPTLRYSNLQFNKKIFSHLKQQVIVMINKIDHPFYCVFNIKITEHLVVGWNVNKLKESRKTEIKWQIGIVRKNERKPGRNIKTT